MTGFQITGAELRGKRERLGLTLKAFAVALEMGEDGERQLARLEAQSAELVPGPLGIAVQAYADGWRPPHMRAGPALTFDAPKVAA